MHLAKEVMAVIMVEDAEMKAEMKAEMLVEISERVNPAMDDGDFEEHMVENRAASKDCWGDMSNLHHNHT